MDENTNNPLTPDFSGSDFTPKSYDIAPEDADIAASISNFDPIDDVPSPVQWIGGDMKTPARLSAKMLPPHLKAEVESQLGAMPVGDARDAREHALTYAALRQGGLDARVRLGAGAGANVYVKETFALAREKQQIEVEAQQVMNELNEVVRVDVSGYDPVTGEAQTKTVYRIEGERRRHMELRHAELIRNLGHLDGVEGARRLQKAKFEAVEAEKAIRAQVSERKLSLARADEINRELRIEEQAQAFAKNRRNTIG